MTAPKGCSLPHPLIACSWLHQEVPHQELWEPLRTFLGAAQPGRTQAQVVAREGQSVDPLRLQLSTNSLNLQQAHGT